MKNRSTRWETLDAVRAGLRVEDVDFANTLTPRLMEHENTRWRRVVDTLEEHADRDRATCNRLRILRRQVLNGEHRRKPDRALPQFALGTAAGVALFLGVATGWDALRSQSAPDATRTASIEPAAIDSAEFANNIDFYTWLEKQSDTVADSGGG